MLRIASALALIAVAATAVFAQNVAVIKERQSALKAMGDASEGPIKMMKGEAKFDLAKVKAALAVMQEKTVNLPNLFPDDSKTGGKTAALPAIWTDKKDFASRYAKLNADAKAASTSITDEITFQEIFPKVVGNCGGCHKKYKQKD